MHATGFRTFSGAPAPVPHEVLGRWALVEAEGLVGHASAPLVRIEIEHGRPGPETLAMHRVGRGRYRAVVYVNASATTVTLQAYGALATPAAGRLSRLRPIGSWQAALRVLARPGALRRLLGRTPPPLDLAGWKARLREAEAATIFDLAVPYRDWLGAFAAWPSAVEAAEPGPRIALVVFARGPSAALDATLGAIGGHEKVVVRPGEDWRIAAARLALPGGSYLGLIGAGEVLHPGALALAGRMLADRGDPPIALADEDRLDEAGHRIEPSFGPEPNHVLMLSGTLAQGLWLVRADVVAALDVAPSTNGHVELARLSLWLAHWRARGDAGRRLPALLTSRRHDVVPPPAEDAAAIVDDHLRRAELPLRARAAWPVRLEPLPVQPEERVAALVPSTLVAPHSERCLTAMLRETGAPGLEIIVAVAQPHPLDAAQRAVADRLVALGARVVHLPEPRFNFSRAVNLAARETQAARLLLLNDDVSPRGPDWLARMCAFLADPSVGIVGARLCYPNGTIQHAGVIMGVSGLCDHAFRHLPEDAPGYGFRAQLPQQLSVVTGACLLIKAEAWTRVGGMDEAYPSAFNDVDLCLRVDELGLQVVLSDATLVHHELQTYGSHYAGERAAFEKIEIARMRARWADRIADDPFYNPNLSLVHDDLWSPALPPRHLAARQGTASCRHA